VNVYKDYLKEREKWADPQAPTTLNNPSLPGPVVPTLTDEDTSVYPSEYIGSLAVYLSPWIDLCSADPHIASISRQVLNLEAAYANWCGARTIIVPGPRRDDDSRGIIQYARAIREALHAAGRANIVIHMPMYREPGLDETAETLSDILVPENGPKEDGPKEIDLFTAWDSWHTIRSICNYSMRLFVALRIPRRVPEKPLQDRWFAEPLHYLTIGKNVFQPNRAGHPSLTKHHQALINHYMRLRSIPWIILCDVGPRPEELPVVTDPMAVDFPSLAEATQALKEKRKPHVPAINAYVAYMKYLERQQPPYSAMETPALTSFQDWLQPPLQPLADNLESATYEVFEGDPVKYDQYEKAIAQAMIEWKELKKRTDDANPPYAGLIVAVAGAGRGPLVSRALRAAEATGTEIHMWAIEKNQDAFVYLTRKNKVEWGNKVNLVKTDMRGWEGPWLPGYEGRVRTGVDILITELLGSFGDNELSPECLDGIQKLLSKDGISIPHSYTAHLSPISTPRLYADISSRITSDPNAFETPWVVRLFAVDYVAQKVPGRPRFQQAWEFVHPVPVLRLDNFTRDTGSDSRVFATGGVGSISGASGTNDHNSRYCHLTFVCPNRGVIHGLAGFFEAVLYTPQTGEPRKEPIELSILPDQIDRKSKDMISWFPIFFPLKVCDSVEFSSHLNSTLIMFRNLSNFLRTRSSRSACGDRQTTPRFGMNGWWRSMLGLAPRRASRLGRQSCIAAARLRA
jgi:protein arginine N-methyltransferase 5